MTISPTPCWFLLLQTPPGWPVTQTLELSKRRKAGFPSMAAMAEETALPWMVVSSMMIPAESARTSARMACRNSRLIGAIIRPNSGVRAAHPSTSYRSQAPTECTAVSTAFSVTMFLMQPIPSPSVRRCSRAKLLIPSCPTRKAKT